MGARAPRLSTWVVLLLAAAALFVSTPAALAGPLTAPPLLTATDPLLLLALQQEELTAGEASADDHFGFAVAIDGDTALIGARGANAGQGAAYVFARSGTTWSEQAMLTASDGEAGDLAGCSVALRGDVALVGAQYGGDKDQGAAYVFIRSGASWSEQAKLAAADAMPGFVFGMSVALEEGQALVGAPGAEGDDNSPGAAYVFTRTGTDWSQEAKLTGAGSSSRDRFGTAVAIDGDTALVGAITHDPGGIRDQGAAYVFARSDATWSRQTKLTATDGAAGDEFGSSVALDGSMALVGAWNARIGANEGQGAAYVFALSGATWSQGAKLTAAGGAAGDHLGQAAALDGGAALVGTSLRDGGRGGAFVFTHDGTGWSQLAALAMQDGAAWDQFGRSVALDGRTALVGALGHDAGVQADQGAAYVFGLPCTVTPRVRGGNGTISPATPQKLAYGSTPTFSFTPASGYLLGRVLVDGKPAALLDPDRYTFAPLTADHAISVEFTAIVLTPDILKLSPTAGGRGAVVTITGRSFGKRRGAGFVTFGKVKAGKYLSWSATKIKVKVPAKASFGKVKVTVTTPTGRSAAKTFTVRR